MAELGPPRMASTVRRFSVPVTRRRYPTPAVRNAEGLHAYPTPTASTIMAHVFPAGGATERLPDGREVASEVEVHAPVAGSLRAGDTPVAAEQFLSLLRGTIFMRRMLGVPPVPGLADIDTIVSAAVDTFLRAWAANPPR